MRSVLITALLVGCASFADADAGETKFEVSNARIFQPPQGGAVTAGYAVLKNDGDQDIKVKLQSVAPFARAETHETIEKDGLMSMRRVQEFTVPARGILEMKPGGRHMMLFNSTRALKAGELLTANFSVDGQPFSAKFKVEVRSATNEGHHHHK